MTGFVLLMAAVVPSREAVASGPVKGAQSVARLVAGFEKVNPSSLSDPARLVSELDGLGLWNDLEMREFIVQVRSGGIRVDGFKLGWLHPSLPLLLAHL